MDYVCFDVGGTMVKYALLNKSGDILQRDEFPTIHSSKEEFYQSLIDKIQYFEPNYNLQAIGISMPGVIDPQTGECIFAGALYHLYGENVKSYLEEKTSYPVYIENDANCALLAEKFKGNAQDESDVLLLTVGTGIGGAVLVNNSLVNGKGFKAGEFGMMRIDAIKQPNMTLHDLASTSALIQFYKEALEIPAKTQVDGRIIMEEMEINEEVKKVVDRWIHHLAAGIFNMAVFMNPGKILVGGGISANPKLLPLITNKLEENIHWSDFQTTVEMCKFRNDAGIIGALYHVLQNENAI